MHGVEVRQRMEVLDLPADRWQPARLLEAPTLLPIEERGGGRDAGSNGAERRPCGSCGRHHLKHEHGLHGQTHQPSPAPRPHSEPPPFMRELLRRYQVVQWLESNLVAAHQAVAESDEPEHSRLVVSASLTAFLEVVEDVMFHCNEVAVGLAASGEAAGAPPCAVRGVWDALESKLVFYAKELRFLGVAGGR